MRTVISLIYAFLLMLVFNSCEEVIKIDLNSSEPKFVVEGIVSKDSGAVVRLTQTSDYFSNELPAVISDAKVIIRDGFSSEVLSYNGNGYYVGSTIKGTEKRNYEIEILHNGVTYKGSSIMLTQAQILNVHYSKDNSKTIFNPKGETMFTISCEFSDEPVINNHYMVRFILDGKLLGGSFYVLTENNSSNGIVEAYNRNPADADTIKFSEWMFYEGGEADIQVFSIDESIYDYFVQLNDVLYWKRRLYPPAVYNPSSNIDNGALGYFAAWSFDSKKINLE